jgi:hypothetical protein
MSTITRAPSTQATSRIETHTDEPVESRRDARAAFAGLSGLRRNVH